MYSPTQESVVTMNQPPGSIQLIQPSTKTVNITVINPLTSGLSTTSTDVINNYNRLIVQINDPSVSEALKGVELQQKNNEEELITKTSICDVPMLSSLRDHIGGLRAVQLKEYTQRQFQNPAAMQAAMCTVDSIFYTSPYDIGSLYLNNRIRMYIHNLRQIGSESIEGYSLLADFENAKDMFIVKVARSPIINGTGSDGITINTYDARLGKTIISANNTLLHEVVVGLYGTNSLRKYVPTFTYVFGAFKCSPPLVDPDTKKVVTWCLHDDNAVNYVLYENVFPSVTMEKYLEKCTGREFLNAYMNILYSLRIALKLIDYTHYDLNYKAVLIRTLIDSSTKNAVNGQFQIPYETERGVEYIITDVIPTITDYSFSHIKTGDIIDKSGKVIKQGQHYGVSGLVPFSIYPYRSWIMHDLYKFLMFCMMGASRYNNQSVFNEATKIFRFFNHTEDPIVAINSQAPIKFAFPLTEATNTLSINDLAVYIRRVCNCDFIVSERSNIPILNCEKMCLTENIIYSNIGMDPNGPIGIPDNIIEFYDIAVRLQNQGREQEKINVSRAFPYQQSMRSHINKMHNLVNDLIDLRRKLRLVDVGDMTLNQVLTYNTMMIVRSMYVSVGAIVDKTVELRFLYEIGTAVARSYQDDAAIRIMDNIMIQFDRDVRPSLEDAKRILGRNDDYLDRIQNDTVTQEAIRRDQRLRWYWDGRKLFDIVFGRVIITNDISNINTIPQVPTIQTIYTFQTIDTTES